MTDAQSEEYNPKSGGNAVLEECAKGPPGCAKRVKYFVEIDINKCIRMFIQYTPN